MQLYITISLFTRAKSVRIFSSKKKGCGFSMLLAYFLDNISFGLEFRFEPFAVIILIPLFKTKVHMNFSKKKIKNNKKIKPI